MRGNAVSMPVVHVPLSLVLAVRFLLGGKGIELTWKVRTYSPRNWANDRSTEPSLTEGPASPPLDSNGCGKKKKRKKTARLDGANQRQTLPTRLTAGAGWPPIALKKKKEEGKAGRLSAESRVKGRSKEEKQ